eukprot:gene11507-15413_t
MKNAILKFLPTRSYMRWRCFSSSSNVVISFKDVSFEFTRNKPVLDEVNFKISNGGKYTIMGQNGAGKSTIIKLMNGSLFPSSGLININTGLAVSTAMQVMPKEYKELTVLDFFTKVLHGNNSGISSRIAKALQTVELVAPYDRIIRTFSGGQQARLLLAAALILEPDVLLLDEPTNNLDSKGIEHLTSIIQQTEKTCIVISHDEDFLNSFTDAVLYLDVYSKKVEQYDGDYHTVKEEVAKRIKKENAENARLLRAAQAKKDQANVFANKGGGMRKVAKKMREEAEKMEDATVDVRKEDKGLVKFEIPCQNSGLEGSGGLLLEIASITLRTGEMAPLKSGPMRLDKGVHVQIVGPNGIGKTTFLEHLANCDPYASTKTTGLKLNPKAKIGYYRQDFNTLDFNNTVINTLRDASHEVISELELRSLAAKFFLRGDIVNQKIITLSEGQKGLLSFVCLILMKPAILILDEPTNHINFRHLPAIAEALNKYSGAMILVSHDSDFVSKVKIDAQIDLAEDI